MRIPSLPSQKELSLALAGNVEFGSPRTQGTQQSPQNIKGTWWQGTSPATPNTDFAVPHTLGTIPTGFDVKNINKAAHVFQGVTAWTNTTIYLQSDQASVTMTLFVL